MLAMTFLGYTITTLWIWMWFILSILIALWPASVASKKGYSFLLFFLISIFFWWITLFVAIFLPDKSSQAVVTSTPDQQIDE